jgi:phenylpyruvate tautomerase PptA (4-oxalocrotonate tautomerase family)
MPTIEVTINRLPAAERQRLVERLTSVFAELDIPADWVKIVFRHIEPDDFFRGGRPLLGERMTKSGAIAGPGIVDLTVGDLGEDEKRHIAKGVSDALLAAGVPEEFVLIHFLHVTGRDVAEAGGVFPFRPEGSPW